jgi:hypothetical protein
MINRETILGETYNKRYVPIEDARIEVFTAIHHFTGVSNNSRLDLCSELKFEVEQGPAEFSLRLNLTADQMEDLADALRDAAENYRKLKAMLDADELETKVAAKEAIQKAKDEA